MQGSIALLFTIETLRKINTSLQRLLDYTPIAHCANLTHFRAGNTPQLCDDDLALLAHCTRLRHLTLVYCYNITSEGLAHLTRHCALEEVEKNVS